MRVSQERFPGRVMMLDLARRGVPIVGGSDGDGDGDSGGDKGASDGDGGNKGGDGGGGGQSDAEKRAAAAERENKRLRAEQKRRDDAESKRKRDAEVKSIDDAKKLADDAENRARKAEEENERLRGKFQAQTDSKLEKLPKADSERLGKYRETLSLGDFDQLVTEELERQGKAGVGSSDDKGGKGNPPPPGIGGVTRVFDKTGEGRKLEPKTGEVLDELGVGDMQARRLLAVESNGRAQRFVMPPKELTRFMRERSLRPAVLTEESMQKLVDSITK